MERINKVLSKVFIIICTRRVVFIPLASARQQLSRATSPTPLQLGSTLFRACAHVSYASLGPSSAQTRRIDSLRMHARFERLTSSSNATATRHDCAVYKYDKNSAALRRLSLHGSVLSTLCTGTHRCASLTTTITSSTRVHVFGGQRVYGSRTGMMK